MSDLKVTKINVYKLIISTSIKGQNKLLFFFFFFFFFFLIYQLFFFFFFLIYQLFTFQISTFFLYSFFSSKLSSCKFQIKPIQKFQIFGDLIVMLVEFIPKQIYLHGSKHQWFLRQFLNMSIFLVSEYTSYACYGIDNKPPFVLTVYLLAFTAENKSENIK